MRIPYGLDNKSRLLLRSNFQQYNFVEENKEDIHSHPCLAVERLLVEKYVYGLCQERNRGVTILDIGGAPKRHLKFGRLDVHSCCPILEPADVLRHADYTRTVQIMSCSHNVMDCDCVDQPVYMAIHSMYYLSQADILTLLHKDGPNVMFSAVHHFPDYIGSFYEGEAFYQLFEDQVVMRVRDNAQPYKHSALHWLRASDYYYLDGKAMAWSIVKRINNTYVYKLTKSKIFPEMTTETMFDLPQIIKDDTYYGRVLVSTHTVGQKQITTALTKEQINVDRIFSIGKMILFTRRDQVSVPVPKGFVQELATYVAYKPRNESTFATLGERAKQHIKNYNYPADYKSACIVVATAIAFTLNLNLEIGVVSHLNFENAHLRTLFERILKGYYIPSLPMAGQFILGPYWSLFVYILACRAKQDNAASVTSGFKNFNITHESFRMPLDFIHYVSPIPLIGRLCHNVLKPMRPGAKIRMLDNLAREKIDYILYGVGFCNRIPIVYGSNGHNEQNSLMNRALMDTPTPIASEFEKFSSFVFDHFDTIFPDWKKIEKYSFTAWNNCGNFNTAKRKAHELARAKVAAGFYDFNNPKDLSHITTKKTFVKREKLCIGDLMPEDKDVRTIQGCTDEFNVIVGPFVRAFQLQIKRIWNAAHFCYSTSGANANEIGQWFDNFQHNNPYFVYCEDDFSRFDASISRNFLEMEIQIMTRFGLPQRAETVLRAAIETHGYTMRGNFYSVDGTRHSGDPQTSVGNTLINGLVHLYAVFCLVADANTVFQNVKMVAVGDDNLIVLPRRLLTDEQIMTIPSTMKRLGLNSVFQIRPNSHFVEYCSARFWPATVGGRLRISHPVTGRLENLETHVLGPKPGRVLQKLGYFIDGQDKLPIPLLVGTALGLKDDVAHIPILNKFVEIPLRVYGANYRPLPDKYKPHVDATGEPNDKTNVMVEDLYGLTPSDLITLREYFNSIKSLPVVLQHELLTRVFEVDCD